MPDSFQESKLLERKIICRPKNSTAAGPEVRSSSFVCTTFMIDCHGTNIGSHQYLEKRSSCYRWVYLAFTWFWKILPSPRSVQKEFIFFKELMWCTMDGFGLIVIGGSIQCFLLFSKHSTFSFLKFNFSPKTSIFS